MFGGIAWGELKAWLIFSSLGLAFFTLASVVADRTIQFLNRKNQRPIFPCRPASYRTNSRFFLAGSLVHYLGCWVLKMDPSNLVLAWLHACMWLGSEMVELAASNYRRSSSQG